MHNRSRVLQAHPLAYTKCASGPARVHEPALRIMLLQAAAEHFRIHSGSKREERRTETRRKFRHRLTAQTCLGSSKLRRVAGKKVIHRLLWCQLRNGRKDAESIGS